MADVARGVGLRRGGERGGVGRLIPQRCGGCGGVVLRRGGVAYGKRCMGRVWESPGGASNGKRCLSAEWLECDVGVV